MSRGFPDNFGQSYWPKYGAPIITMDSVTYPAGDDNKNVRWTVAGQGVLAALRFRLYGATAIHNYYSINLEIDGVEDDILGSTEWKYTGLAEDIGRFLRIVYSPSDKLDDIWALTREIPFQSGVKLYVTTSATTPELNTQLRSMLYRVT